MVDGADGELPSVHVKRRFEKFLANAADDDKVY